MLFTIGVHGRYESSAVEKWRVQEKFIILDKHYKNQETRFL